MTGLVNNKKTSTLASVSVAQMVSCMLFHAIDPGSNPPFAELFFLPFQVSYRIRKAFIFNTNEGNNQKVENKSIG